MASQRKFVRLKHDQLVNLAEKYETKKDTGSKTDAQGHLAMSSLLCLALSQIQPGQLTNAVVVKLAGKHSLTTWDQITSGVCAALRLPADSVVPDSLRRSFQDVKNYRGQLFRNRKRKEGQQRLDNFLAKTYSPPKKKKRPSLSSPSPTSSTQKVPRVDHDCMQAELNYRVLLHDHTVTHMMLNKKDKELTAEKKRNRSLSKRNQELETTNAKLKTKVASWCPKRQNFKLARKSEVCCRWKQKCQELKQKVDKEEVRRTLKNKEHSEKKSQNRLGTSYRAQKHRHKKLLTKFKDAKKLLQEKNIQKRSVKDLMEEIKKTKEQVRFLEDEVEKIHWLRQQECCAQPVIETKGADGAYTDEIRKCMFQCVQSQVPVHRAGGLMEYIVRTVTPHQLDSTPSASTVCRATREMAQLSDVQVGEAMTTQKNNTLGWDATCIDGTHINEVHVCTEEGPLMLGVSELPGGKTDDYHTNISEHLEDITAAYSKSKQAEPAGVLADIHSNISNTISDRVAVNHCVVQRLEGTFGKKLYELNCNVHPLDGLANKSRSVLKANDRDTDRKGACFGKECCTVNTIRAFCKLRYKANCGDPSGFKHYMRTNKIAASLLPRYVGNRIHVMFHLAGVIFVYRSPFLLYLERFCPGDNGLRRSLLQDLGNKEILDQLQILGLFGKLLTGPWMTKFYGNTENHSNLEMNGIMKQSLETLRSIQQDPELLYSSQKDVFGEQLKEDDPVLEARRAPEKKRATKKPEIEYYRPGVTRLRRKTSESENIEEESHAEDVRYNINPQDESALQQEVTNLPGNFQEMTMASESQSAKQQRRNKASKRPDQQIYVPRARQQHAEDAPVDHVGAVEGLHEELVEEVVEGELKERASTGLGVQRLVDVAPDDALPLRVTVVNQAVPPGGREPQNEHGGRGGRHSNRGNVTTNSGRYQSSEHDPVQFDLDNSHDSLEWDYQVETELAPQRNHESHMEEVEEEAVYHPGFVDDNDMAVSLGEPHSVKNKRNRRGNNRRDRGAKPQPEPRSPTDKEGTTSTGNRQQQQQQQQQHQHQQQQQQQQQQQRNTGKHHPKDTRHDRDQHRKDNASERLDQQRGQKSSQSNQDKGRDRQRQNQADGKNISAPKPGQRGRGRGKPEELDETQLHVRDQLNERTFQGMVFTNSKFDRRSDREDRGRHRSGSPEDLRGQRDGKQRGRNERPELAEDRTDRQDRGHRRSGSLEDLRGPRDGKYRGRNERVEFPEARANQQNRDTYRSGSPEDTRGHRDGKHRARSDRTELPEGRHSKNNTGDDFNRTRDARDRGRYSDGFDREDAHDDKKSNLKVTFARNERHVHVREQDHQNRRERYKKNSGSSTEEPPSPDSAHVGGLLRLPARQQAESHKPHSPVPSTRGTRNRGRGTGRGGTHRVLYDPNNPKQHLQAQQASGPQLHFHDPSDPMEYSPDPYSHPVPSNPYYYDHAPYDMVHQEYSTSPQARGDGFYYQYAPAYCESTSLTDDTYSRDPYYHGETEQDLARGGHSKAANKSKAEAILREVTPLDSQLCNILSRGVHGQEGMHKVMHLRREVQNKFEQVVLLEPDLANKHNVEHLLWRSVYYQVIELCRKKLHIEGQEPQQSEAIKNNLLALLDEGMSFYEGLLRNLQLAYGFTLEDFMDPTAQSPDNISRTVKLALLSAQRTMICLGDIGRYREQANHTSNYGKARSWYMKAQQIAPKNGRPYNQLAILALYTRRKLDAVYYYMRSLAASNPFITARESLMSLFDEARKKAVASESRKVSEQNARARKPERRRRTSSESGHRVELWVSADGSTSEDQINDDDDDMEDLRKMPTVELNKKFIVSYLNTHGKLFTKIGMDVFEPACEQMLREFQALVDHSPAPVGNNRLLQLMAINMFAVENVLARESQTNMESDCRSMILVHAVQLGLDLFALLVQRCTLLFEHHLHTGDCQVMNEDLHQFFPSVKVWSDWMMCHMELWNPPPSVREQDLGPRIDVWQSIADLCNILKEVDISHVKIYSQKKEGCDPILLGEDSMMAGFVPLLSLPQLTSYVHSTVDKDVARDCLRVEKLQTFGDYLCGIEPPLLSYNVETYQYESVAPDTEAAASEPENPSEHDLSRDDEDIIIESDSEETELNTSGEDDQIRRLKAKKHELERRMAEQNHYERTVRATLEGKQNRPITLEIHPQFLVPDTNCFIDHQGELSKLLACRRFTIIVPLVVINELDGLAKGSKSGHYESREHADMVKSEARSAVQFLEEQFECRNSRMRALTSKGSVLDTIAFRSEESSSEGNNDDLILSCCLHYCKDKARDFMPKAKDEPIRLQREVVLLTEDRNLRLKAHLRNVPVKDIPAFLYWAKIT